MSAHERLAYAGACRGAEADAAAGREALALVECARRAAEQIESAGGWRASRTPEQRDARR